MGLPVLHWTSRYSWEEYKALIHFSLATSKTLLKKSILTLMNKKTTLFQGVISDVHTYILCIDACTSTWTSTRRWRRWRPWSWSTPPSVDVSVDRSHHAAAYPFTEQSRSHFLQIIHIRRPRSSQEPTVSSTLVSNSWFIL